MVEGPVLYKGSKVHWYVWKSVTVHNILTTHEQVVCLFFLNGQ